MKRLISAGCLIMILSMNLYAQTIFDVIKSGDFSEVQSMIEKDTSLIRLKDTGGCTPLHRSVMEGSIRIAEYILSSGSDINAKDNRGFTPLHYACNYDFENIAVLLIERSAEINLKENRGLTPVFLAARSGNLNLVKMLVDKGADPNGKISGVWVTPLSWAAENGHSDVVNYLLTREVDVDTGSFHLKRFSISKGLEKLFFELKRKGADFRLRNANGGGMVHMASEGGNLEIMASFIQNQSDLDLKDRYGRTPCHYAAYGNKKGAVKFLIEKGARLDERDLAGKTAYNIAVERGNSDLDEILKDAGASTEPQQFPEFKGPYLGQKPPGLVPDLFAPGIVSTNEIEHGNITISPDGNEIFWTSSFITSLGERSAGSFKIWSSKYEDDKWTIPLQAFFTKNEITTDDVPFFSPDGSKIFFMSRRAVSDDGPDEAAENYWYVVKKDDNWSSPILLDNIINSLRIRWQMSVANSGSLYFGASKSDGMGGSDIYFAKFVDGKYMESENMGLPINSPADESGPYVSPDESYIIFTGESREDRNFKNGLYVSFKNKEGKWNMPVYLGDEINMGGSASPYVSPDGKYLFFNSGRNGNYDIYWVSAEIFEELRQKE